MTRYFEQIADAIAGRIVISMDVPRWLIEHDPEIGSLSEHVHVRKNLKRLARLTLHDFAAGHSTLVTVKVPLVQPTTNLDIMARSLRSKR